MYFFSLDAGSTPAVIAARAWLNLPYHSATIRVSPSPRGVDYRCVRNADGTAEFSAVYRSRAAEFRACEGSLEHFLTERYCLYHLDARGDPYRLEIHHAPWRLQIAEAQIVRNTMLAANGLAVPDRSPLLHFAKRQDMVAWLPTSIG